MKKEEDRKLKAQAIELLNSGLSEHEPVKDSYDIDFDLLLSMYGQSKSILQNNADEKALFNTAQSLFETCIRIIRCTHLGNNEAIIKGKVTPLNPEILFKLAQVLFAQVQELTDRNH